MADGNAFSSLLLPLLLLVGLYILLIRPQRSRAKALAKVRESVRPGSQVITTAGLYATVLEVAEDQVLVLEIAPGVHARFASAAVVKVLDDNSAGDGTGDPDPGDARPDDAPPAAAT